MAGNGRTDDQAITHALRCRARSTKSCSMKISRNTDRQLILDWTPWGLGSALIALIILFLAIAMVVPMAGGDIDLMWWLFAFMFLIGAGLWGLMLVLFVKRRQLVLDRDTGKVTLRIRSFLNATEQRHDLTRLKAAALDYDHGEGLTLQRPVLVLASRRNGGADRRVPIHSYFTNGDEPGQVADLINDWLAAGETP